MLKTALVALGLAGAAVGSPAFAAPPDLVRIEKLGWETANQLAVETVRICTSRGFAVTATVVDPTGHAQAVVKGDTAALQSLSVSYRKAYTAFSYGQTFNKNSTGELIAAKMTGPENGALNTVPEVLFIAGGVTLRRADNTVIGGIGVSGAPGGDKDEACALDAIAKLKESFR